jgi:hypothetical protein
MEMSVCNQCYRTELLSRDCEQSLILQLRIRVQCGWRREGRTIFVQNRGDVISELPFHGIADNWNLHITHSNGMKCYAT